MSLNIEMWGVFGDVVWRLFIGLIIILITAFIAKLVSKFLDRQYSRIIEKKFDIIDEKRFATQYAFLKRLFTAVIYLVGIIAVISLFPQLRSISVALLASAGFAGIVIGLAAQKVIGGLLSGVMLSVFQPFRVGDYVTFKNEYGQIEDISLFYTVLRTWENKRLVIPNYLITDEVVENWSIADPKIFWVLDIGISYDSDIDLARKIMLEEAEKHPNVMKAKEVDPTAENGERKAAAVRVHELADFAVVMRLGFWVYDRSQAYATAADLRESIKKRFDAEGVEIPFPYRTIIYKKDLPTPSKLDT